MKRCFRFRVSLRTVVATVLTGTLVCALGEGPPIDNHTLFYPNYRLDHFGKDIRKTIDQAYVKNPAAAFAEKEALKFLSNQLTEQVKNLTKGDKQIAACMGALGSYIGQGGAYYYNMDANKWIDPLAAHVWDNTKKQILIKAFGHAAVDHLSVMAPATVPMKVIEAAWQMWITTIKNGDLNRALAWYVNARYEWDVQRHRDVFQSGGPYRRRLSRAIWPGHFQLKQNPAPNPFSHYGFAPYYIHVRENPGLHLSVFGKWEVVYGGVRPGHTDGREGFYLLWANILAAERGASGTTMEKEIKYAKKMNDPLQMRYAAKRGLDNHLSEFMYLVESYYYDLYCHRFHPRITRYVALEGLALALIKERNRRITAARDKQLRDYLVRRDALQAAEANASWLLGVADNAESNAGDDLADRDAEEEQAIKMQHEQAYVQDMSTAMQASASSACECQSGRVNYGGYVTFTNDYGPSSGSYTTLQFAANQSLYLSIYNGHRQQLYDRWQQNAAEFETLRKKFENVGRHFSRPPWDPQRHFAPATRYHDQVGDKPVNFAAGCLPETVSVLKALWSTNEVLDTELIQGIDATVLPAVLDEVAAVQAKIRAIIDTIERIMAEFPGEPQLIELEESAVKASALYNDLVNRGHDSWDYFSRGALTGTSEMGPLGQMWYSMELLNTARVDVVSPRTDLTNFTPRAYEQFAHDLIACTDLHPVYDARSNHAATVSASLPRDFQEMVSRQLLDLRQGLDAAFGTEIIMQAEQTNRLIEPLLEWTHHDDPYVSLGLLASLEVPQIDGAGGVYDVAVTGNVAVLAFGEKGVRAVDISTPPSLSLLSHVQTSGTCHRVVLAGNTAYIAGGAVELVTLDLSDPSHLPGAQRSALNVSGDGDSRDVAVQGGFAFVADGPAGLAVIDVSAPFDLAPSNVVATVHGAAGAVSVDISGNHVFVGCGTNGMRVVDIAEPHNPFVVATLESGGYSVGTVRTVEGYAGLCLGTNGFVVLDVSDPTAPEHVDHIDLDFDVRDFGLGQEFVLLAGAGAEGEGILAVVEMEAGLLFLNAQRAFPGEGRAILPQGGRAWIGTTPDSWLHLADVSAPPLDDDSNMAVSDTGDYAFVPRFTEESLWPEIEVQVVGTGSGTVTIDPGGYTNVDRAIVTYSNNTTVTLTAIASGEAAFSGWEGDLSGTATTAGLTLCSNTYVAARFDRPAYTVTASAGTGGGIEPAGVHTVRLHDAMFFTISNAADHVIADVQVDGTSRGAVSIVELYDIASNRTVSATFQAVGMDAHGVASGARYGGDVTPLGWNTFAEHSTQTFAVTPWPGYQVLNVAVDGTNYGRIDSFTFTNLVGVHHLEAEFGKASWTASTVTRGHGTIEPAPVVPFLAGSTSVVVNVIADPWYYVAELTTNGVAVSGVGGVDVTNVVMDLTGASTNVILDVRFAPRVTATHGVPLWWMVAHGVTNYFEAMAGLDLDGDGHDTWQEWIADTDPKEYVSSLRFRQPSAEGGEWSAWLSTSADRLYALEGVTNGQPAAGWIPLGPAFPGSGEADLLSLPQESGMLLLRARATVPDAAYE